MYDKMQYQILKFIQLFIILLLCFSFNTTFSKPPPGYITLNPDKLEKFINKEDEIWNKYSFEISLYIAETILRNDPNWTHKYDFIQWTLIKQPNLNNIQTFDIQNWNNIPPLLGSLLVERILTNNIQIQSLKNTSIDVNASNELIKWSWEQIIEYHNHQLGDNLSDHYTDQQKLVVESSSSYVITIGLTQGSVRTQRYILDRFKILPFDVHQRYIETLWNRVDSNVLWSIISDLFGRNEMKHPGTASFHKKAWEHWAFKAVAYNNRHDNANQYYDLIIPMTVISIASKQIKTNPTAFDLFVYVFKHIKSIELKEYARQRIRANHNKFDADQYIKILTNNHNDMMTKTKNFSRLHCANVFMF